MVAAVLCVLLRCGAEETHPHPAAAPTPPQPQDGGTLQRRLESDVNTLNYVMHSTDFERNVLAYLHDSVVDLDARLQPIPATASRWNISPDGRTFTFTIDPRATFSDGTPVLASDLVFTLRKIVEVPAPQLSGYFEGLDLKQTRAIDQRTAQVVFDRARAGQLSAFNNVAVLPERVYRDAKFADDEIGPVVGNGPYRLLRHDRGQRIVLERREDYWRTRPFIQTILFNIITDDTVAWNAMKRGDLDEMRVRADVVNLEGNRPDVQGRIALHRVYTLGYNFFPWNTRDPLFQDKRARRAMSMCLDRDAIIKNIYHGFARPATGPFTPDQWAFNPAVKAVPYDLAGATRLLNELGWRDTNGDGILDRNGKRFEFEMIFPAGNAISRDLSQIFQGSLRKVGVQMNITPLDGASFFQRMMSGKYQSASLAWSLDPDPDPYTLFHGSQVPPNGQNLPLFSNPEVDRLLVEAREQLDQNARTRIYHRIHELLADEQPYTWSVQVAHHWAVNRRLQNVAISPGYGLFLWYPGPHQWWIAERRDSN